MPNSVLKDSEAFKRGKPSQSYGQVSPQPEGDTGEAIKSDRSNHEGSTTKVGIAGRRIQNT